MGVEDSVLHDGSLWKPGKDYRVNYQLEGCSGPLTANFYEASIDLRHPADIKHIMVLQRGVNSEGKAVVSTIYIDPTSINQLWSEFVIIEGRKKASGEPVRMEVCPSEMYFLDSKTMEYYPARSEKKMPELMSFQ